MKIRAKRQKRRRGKLAFLCAFLRLRTAHGEFDVRKVILHVQNILRMLGDSVCENRLKATDFVCSHGASRRNDQLSLFRPIAYRVKGRSPLTGRGVGAPQACRIAQKQLTCLVLHHCGKGSRGEVPCRGAGREPRKRGASRRNDRLTLLRIIAYRVKGRSPLPGRGAGAPQTRRIAQKQSAYLVPYHCVPGQGAKSLAGARGGSPASAA